MRHHLTRVCGAALAVVMLIAFVACSPNSSSPAAAGLSAQTTKVGDVEVKATPTQFDGGGAAFTIALDTHAGSLDADLASLSRLEVGGTTWPVVGWEGAPAGGHHREGTLRFRAPGLPVGTATLTLGGLTEPARFTWDLKAGG